jgi:hypothetical protein
VGCAEPRDADRRARGPIRFLVSGSRRGSAESDGLPITAFFHVDAGEHDLPVYVLSPKVPFTSALPVMTAVLPYTRAFISETSSEVSFFGLI